MQATYEAALRRLYTSEINQLLLDLRRYRDRINRFLDKNITTLAMKKEGEAAKSASTAASCRIDGITVTNKRFDELMSGTIEPKTLKEREIASYRFTLNTIDDSFSYIHVSTGAILQLHRDLYRYVDDDSAGRWEDAKRATVREEAVGKVSTRLATTVLITKQTLLRDACMNYRQAIATKACDPLVAICAFALDVLNIRPFAHANGRLSRLMTLLLMYQNDYFACSFASLEAQIEGTKPAYVKAIEASSRIVPEGGCADDATTDYEPFVVYMLNALLACCREFESKHDLGPVTHDVMPLAPSDSDLRMEGGRRKKGSNHPDMNREERMRLRVAMKAEASAALDNPPRLSKAGESLLVTKEKQASTPGASQARTPWSNASDNLAQAASSDDEAHLPQAPSTSAAKKSDSSGAAPSNEDRVRAFFDNLEGAAAKRDVVAACPDMSPKTVERMIQRLMAKGYVKKMGAARATVYCRS